MPHPIRLVLALHNHQPVGNFDFVFEEAYQDSYLPFLDVWTNFPQIKLSLHTSGSLMEWLDEAHPEYVDRLAELAGAGRLEIIGGAYYEPILSMLPSRDRIGQIRQYTEWLQRRLGVDIQGMWTPERVWEQSMLRDLVDAGIQYTIVDDFHFRSAGLADDQLFGYYLSEDDGRLMKIFPGSETLRYMIPFSDPGRCLEYLRGVAESHPGAVVVFGDDGEKFGTWPDTKHHVYDAGWLAQFFQMLTEQADWINVCTASEAAESVAPQGKIYLPDASYREMTEWVLPSELQVTYERVTHEMHDDPRWATLKQFVRGGNWRNFKVKYPEANEMYARMMTVSRRLAAQQRTNPTDARLESARRELYRGQCNCSYWHGAFGGIYLPHLRNAVYRHLIQADNLLDQAADKPTGWTEATAADFDLDGRKELQLSSEKLSLFLSPARGGSIYELDVRSIAHNLLATLSRRPEAYHKKVVAGTSGGDSDVASIHDRVVFKQPDLDRHLRYDDYLRKSLIDHFYDNDTRLADVASGTAIERGDFRDREYEALIRRSPDRVQAELKRDGNAWGHPIRITKTITVESGVAAIELGYVLEGLPADGPLHFAVEFNFAGLAPSGDDRYFFDFERQRLGTLDAQLDLHDVAGVGLADEWVGLGASLAFSRTTDVWTYPIATVSQSEGGFELVHQSTVVSPHWIVTPDDEGKWKLSMTLAIDTTIAENRQAEPAAVVS